MNTVETSFTSDQIKLLEAPLNEALISQRQGASGTMLAHIEGHNAIDQANALFGYGNWGYRPISCTQTVINDALTGEAVGIAYKAVVELQVKGCLPIVECGSQPVATWNVQDCIMSRRANDIKYGKKSLDLDADFTQQEVQRARAMIIEAHEMAEKGAVTDGLKRCFRAFGNQFGNSLYGKSKPQAKKPGLTIGQVKNAAKLAGKANDKETWTAFVTETLGEFTETFSQEQLQKLLDAANKNAVAA